MENKFFVKIANMLKLLLILFIIKLYARNDIFKLVSHITLATCGSNKHLTIKELSHIASYNIGKYLPRFLYFAIIFAI